MIIYFLIFSLILACCILSSVIDSKLLSIFLGILLIFFSGLRGEIDGDYVAYYQRFMQYENIVDTTEYSFILLSNFVTNTINHFNFLLTLYSLLSISLLTYVILVIGNANIYVFLFYYSYYFFLHPMTQIRAAVGVTLVLVSLRFILNRDLLKFLICLALGYFFHISVISFLPFYWILTKYELNVTRCLILMALVVTMSQLFPITLLISNILPSDSQVPIFLKMLAYFNIVENGIGVKTANIYFIVAVIKLCFNLIIRIVYKESFEENRYYKLCLDLYFWAYITYIFFADMNVVGARFAEMFGFVEILLLPQLILWSRYPLAIKCFIITLSFFQLLVVLYVFNLFKPYTVGIL